MIILSSLSYPLEDGIVLRRNANGEPETNVLWVVVAHTVLMALNGATVVVALLTWP